MYATGYASEKTSVELKSMLVKSCCLVGTEKKSGSLVHVKTFWKKALKQKGRVKSKFIFVAQLQFTEVLNKVKVRICVCIYIYIYI